MILIISELSDIQIYWVTHFLNKWGLAHKLLCPSRFPLGVAQCSRLASKGLSEQWRLDDGSAVDAEHVSSVWYRKPGIPVLDTNLDASEIEYALNECRQSLFGLYNFLANSFWISNVHNIRIASNKPLQLRVAQSLGFLIPDTIITNDFNEAKEFVLNHLNGVIYKSLSDGILYTRDGPWQEPFVRGEIYSSRVEHLLDDELQRIGKCPCLLQEYIDKKYEIRATVVHDEVFAVAIHSQENNISKIDFRRAQMQSVKHSSVSLPAKISKKCIVLTRKLGLQFGAIDMIYTPSGDYIFLEINPNGQFGWLEETVGPIISEKIAMLLANPPDIESAIKDRNKFS